MVEVKFCLLDCHLLVAAQVNQEQEALLSAQKGHNKILNKRSHKDTKSKNLNYKVTGSTLLTIKTITSKNLCINKESTPK